MRPEKEGSLRTRSRNVKKSTRSSKTMFVGLVDTIVCCICILEGWTTIIGHCLRENKAKVEILPLVFSVSLFLTPHALLGYLPTFSSVSTDSDGVHLEVCINCGTLFGFDKEALRNSILKLEQGSPQDEDGIAEEDYF